MKKAWEWLLPAYVFACLVLGGASAAGFAANALLQIGAVGLLFFAFMRKVKPSANRAELILKLFACLVVGTILIQFVPLPGSLWNSLPGRAPISAALKDAGIAFGGGFLSLIPHQSLQSAIWALPALAVLLFMLRKPALVKPLKLALTIVAGMMLGVVVGALQVTQGEHSPLYFYDFTNRGFAVGFFSNVNHMATLLLVTIPFQAALLREAMASEEKKLQGVAYIVIGVSFAITLVGLFVNGSLAGYGLALPVTIASAMIVIGTRRIRMIVSLFLAPALLAGVALILLSGGNQAAVEGGGVAGSRTEIFVTAWQALRQFWPVGTGLGTFREVYTLFEDPYTVTSTYINHAHNDYLELVFETGLVGAVLILAFLCWWLYRAWEIWSAPSLSRYTTAGLISSAAILCHECVDYPLRTAAIGVVFAASIALMAMPPSRVLVLDRHSRRRSGSEDDD